MLSLQWLGSLWWCRFEPWLENFHVMGRGKKKDCQVGKKNPILFYLRLHPWPTEVPGPGPGTHVTAHTIAVTHQILNLLSHQETPSNILFFFSSFVFLRLHLRHMGVPRLGVESELQQPTYTTATATPHPSCICHLHLSSR